MRFFGTCWDWKSDAPITEIADRVNDLLQTGAREIGLHLTADVDTYCLVISDQRELDQHWVEELWDAWWRTHISDEPEDVPNRRPDDEPMTWPDRLS